MKKLLLLSLISLTLIGCASMVVPTNPSEFAERVTTSDSEFDNAIQFNGYNIFDMKDMGLLAGYDYQNYFLRGWKDKVNGSIRHQLYVSIKYSNMFDSGSWRFYRSASYSNGEQSDITEISTDVSCYNGCDYTETIGISLSDEFLRDNMDTGFSIRFNAKSGDKNVITISPDYIKGYLQVAK